MERVTFFVEYVGIQVIDQAQIGQSEWIEALKGVQVTGKKKASDIAGLHGQNLPLIAALWFGVLQRGR